MSVSIRIILAIMIGIGIVVGCFFLKKTPETHDSQELKTVEVTMAVLRPIHRTVSLLGKLNAQQSTMLSAQSTGTLTVIAPAGKRIKKGSIIAKIDNVNIERNYQLAQHAEKIAKLQYQRVKQLVEEDILSKNNAEEKEEIWIRSQEKVSENKIALDKLVIRASFDGIVGPFKFQPGAQVQTGEAVVPLYNPDALMVDFDIPPVFFPALHDGTTVIIHNARYALTTLQKMLDNETHMILASVKIKCRQCIIGTSVTVKLEVENKPSALVIPYESVFLRDGKQFVYRVKEGKTELTAVTLGIREKASVEILSGLKEKDRIILRGQDRLYPGERVRIP